MEGESNTTVNKFLLLGLTGSTGVKPFLFITFIAIYGATVVGNLLIVVMLICEPRLHTPMHILLGNLSFLVCCYSSITAVKMLTGFFLPPPQAISFVGSMAHIFVFHFTGGIKIFLLTVIAYNRYVAIFHTHRYMNVMNQMVCVGLLVTCWVGSFLHSVVQVAIIVQLAFCSPKELDNFYCDVTQVVRLTTQTIMTELLMVSNNGLVTLLCFIVLVISYSILSVKLRSHSNQERRKGLSTYASHMSVVMLIFGPCIYIYTRLFSSYPVDKAISLLYTVIPVLNSVIYMLRNKDINVFLRKLW
ncbi:LOW QUALITY PROTEIN: olfactory receptor 4D5-like [Sarcoramphus papa]